MMGIPRERPLDQRPSFVPRQAVIDLGAGAFHLAQPPLSLPGLIRGAVDERRPVRMQAPLASGHLDDASWGVGMGALASLARTARREPGTHLIAVASSWFGELDNGAEFLAEARGSLAAQVELLTPEAEARLVWVAARRHSPAVAGGPVAVISIGASCVQIALGVGAQCLRATSLPIGVSRLCARLLPPGRPLDGDAARVLAQSVIDVAGGATEQVRACRPVALLLAGGTCRALGRVLRAYPDRTRATVLRRSDATTLATLLSRRGDEGVRGHHRENLGPAAVVLSTLLLLLGKDEGTLVCSRLREGVLMLESGHDECH